MQDFLISVIMFGRAHNESKEKSKRISAIYKARRDRNASVICNIAPGWLRKTKDRNAWELDPIRAASVEKVFAMALMGFGVVAIAGRANEEDWPVPSMQRSGKRKADGWHITLVRRVLRNRAAIGEYQPKAGPPVPGFFPAAITTEIFERAQNILNSRAAVPRRRDAETMNIFQGLLKCGSCGSSFVRKNKANPGAADENAKKRNYAIFMCAARVRRKTKCPSWNAQELYRKLVPAVFEHMLEQLSSGEALEAARASEQAAIGALTDAEKRYGNLMRLAEEEAPENRPAGIVARISELESALPTLRKRLSAATGALHTASEITHEGEVEMVISRALNALTDPAQGPARELLRDRLLGTVKACYVWPKLQLAAMLLHAAPERVIWLPLDPSAGALMLSRDKSAGTSLPDLPMLPIKAVEQ
jgi:hypothetical protein